MRSYLLPLCIADCLVNGVLHPADIGGALETLLFLLERLEQDGGEAAGGDLIAGAAVAPAPLEVEVICCICLPFLSSAKKRKGINIKLLSS